MSEPENTVPPRPPILPPAINEEVFAPKRQMQVVRESARKRLKKHHRKFEKVVRKHFKKTGEKDRYVKFYDIGYRYEAVFTEVTTDGMTFLGAAVASEQGEMLLQILAKELKLPAGQDAIVLNVEKGPAGEFQVIQLVALAEFQEIQRLAEKVENAPRAGNPGQ